MIPAGLESAARAVPGGLPVVVPHIDLARYYPYFVAASTAVGFVTVVYLLLLRVVRDRRSR